MTKAYEELWDIYGKEKEFLETMHWFHDSDSMAIRVGVLIAFLMPRMWTEIAPYREAILDAVTRLESDEWVSIREGMIEEAACFNSAGYRRQRTDFINVIDTLYAFGAPS